MVILIGLALAMNILIGLRLIKVSESLKLHDGFTVQIIKHGYDNINTLYNQLKNKTMPIYIHTLTHAYIYIYTYIYNYIYNTCIVLRLGMTSYKLFHNNSPQVFWANKRGPHNTPSIPWGCKPPSAPRSAGEMIYLTWL